MIGATPEGKVAIVAHDAGGAEVLSSHVRQQGIDGVYCLAGPARAIFERKLGPISSVELENAITAADWLLCGTSWQSDLELAAIRLARARGKFAVAWLDHWVNYRARFERDGQLCLPDEIWVSDPQALAIARDQLPNVPLRQVDNPYFRDIRAALAAEPCIHPAIPGRLRVLYVCEPMREHALLRYGDEMHWGYTEEQALDYFLTNVSALGTAIGHILIRRHPAEQAGKYEDIVARHALPVSFSQGHTLSCEVASSDCVVGCNSMAMVVGLIGGKRVISCIPPGGTPCSLPQPDIEKLQELLSQPGRAARTHGQKNSREH